MELTLAKKEQIEIMTEISKAAFDTDIEQNAGKRKLICIAAQ